MPLTNTIAGIWNRFQGELFPNLAEDLGRLTENHQRFVAVLDMKPVETFIQTHSSGRGRPLADRRALARAFIAKAVWDLPTTRALIDRLQCDPKLRRLCGWERVGAIPSEATFSRAFAWFAEMALPERMHGASVCNTLILGNFLSSPLSTMKCNTRLFLLNFSIYLSRGIDAGVIKNGSLCCQ